MRRAELQLLRGSAGSSVTAISVPLDIPEACQIIVTDQRLICSNSVEPRLYNITSFDIALVCHQCGIELTDDLVQKFNSLKTR